MPFGSYKSVTDVAYAHQIICTRASFVIPVKASSSDWLMGELDFAMREVPFDNSEFSVCENFVYPILKEVWKSYTDVMTLWGHEPLTYDDDLCGMPDYFVAKRSPLGVMVRTKTPYLLMVVEAKRDDYEEGWGACLAAMLAAQKLNNDPEQTVYGIVTNGRGWEVGQLLGNRFTHDGKLFSLHNLAELLGALHFVFTKCKHQAAGQPCPA
jgi:hypothetical protein